MVALQFRNLRSDEIQVRPTDTKNKGRATLLLYQDARVAMDILDETVGPENWSKDYYEVAGNVYCKVGIKCPNGEWVYKSDCGTESNMDAEKGQASDAFKRAVVNWGIGRELYATPKVKINCPDSYYYNDKMTMGFTVKEIAFNGKTECSTLVIIDKFGKVVYTLGEEKPVQEKTETKDNETILKEFCSAKKTEPGTNLDELKKFWEFYSKKMPDWKNKVKPSDLWERWLKTA